MGLIHQTSVSRASSKFKIHARVRHYFFYYLASFYQQSLGLPLYQITSSKESWHLSLWVLIYLYWSICFAFALVLDYFPIYDLMQEIVNIWKVSSIRHSCYSIECLFLLYHLISGMERNILGTHLFLSIKCDYFQLIILLLESFLLYYYASIFFL